MVLTILEGRVTKDNWLALEKAYREASTQEEPGMVNSYLVHNSRDTDLWRILSFWSSREALDAMRRSSEKPRGVLIFNTANAEPQLAIFEVVEQIKG